MCINCLLAFVPPNLKIVQTDANRPFRQAEVTRTPEFGKVEKGAAVFQALSRRYMKSRDNPIIKIGLPLLCIKDLNLFAQRIAHEGSEYPDLPAFLNIQSSGQLRLLDALS